VLTRIRFFPALEWVISRVTDLRPRGEARSPAARG
jgi:hypothetical protein